MFYIYTVPKKGCSENVKTFFDVRRLLLFFFFVSGRLLKLGEWVEPILINAEK